MLKIQKEFLLFIQQKELEGIFFWFQYFTLNCWFYKSKSK